MKNTVIEILLPNSDPNGLRIVKLAGWIGRAFIVPRTEIKQIKTLREANFPAVYFLFGEGENGPLVYIGQTDNFDRRMNQQSVGKDYWDIALVFTGESEIDVQYLERVCTEVAQRAKRYEIKNGTGTPGRSISDFQKVTHEDFFEKMSFVATLLGYPIFESIKESLSGEKIYFLKTKEGVDARAQLLADGSLNVLKGSLARIRETVAFWGWSLVARKKFLQDGILVDNGDGVSYKYTKDVLFDSPTAAAATTLGSPVNGWTAWKDEKGNTLDQNLRK